jgi:cytochrome c nitrite reductase small subunit
MTQTKIPGFRLLYLISAMVLFGIVIAATGVYVVDGSQQPESLSFEEIHSFDSEHVETRTTIYGGVVPLAFQVTAQDEMPLAPLAEKGFTVGELMRWAGIISIIAAIVILLFIEFFYRDKVSRLSYRSLMIVSMFALPVVIVLGTGTTVLETTKTVESCASCHVMDPFVNDLFDDESTTLAARHKKNGWISEYQCYTCHTTYGAHGTFEGKRDGFRHWLLYVTNTWEDPIAFAGSYPNQNCTACHGGTQKFREVDSHRALSQRMRADEVSCTSCHGPAHPTPAERNRVPDRAPDQFSDKRIEVQNDELAKLMEMFNEK